MRQTPPSDNRIAIEALWAEGQSLEERVLAIEQAFFVTTHNAPSKVRENMIRTADGTNWNPGSGAGVYQYRGGTWNKLG